MSDLADELIAALERSEAAEISEVALRLCEQPRGGLLSWALCRGRSSEGIRALTFAFAKQSTDQIDRACLFESFRSAPDPSTTINGLEIVKQWAGSDARVLADASALILHSLGNIEAVADAGLDALTACTHSDVIGQLSGRREISSALERVAWPEEFREQVSYVRSVLVENQRKQIKTDTSELVEAQSHLRKLVKRGGVIASIVREACDALESRVKEEKARNDAIDRGGAIHVLRLGTARSKPDLDALTRVTGAWHRLLDTIEGTAKAASLSVAPIATAQGSFELSLSVSVGKNAALFSEELESALSERGSDADINRAMLDVLVSAQRSKALDALVVDPERAIWAHHFRSTAEQAAIAESMLRPQVPPLTSAEIPQADSLERVVKAAHLIAIDNLSVETLELTTPRQVNYYKQAGRLLGILDERNELTSTGRQLLRVESLDQYTMLASLFEQSKCGEAWIAWAGVKQLPQLGRNTAKDFLAASVSGLSPDTVARRAQTLVAWFDVLAPRHYSSLVK